MTPLHETSVRLVRTIDDLTDVVTWLARDREWLAIDTETSGLDWWRGELRLVQLGDVDGAWVLPWKWWAGAVRELIASLPARRQKIVFHNAKFDVHWLQRNGGWDRPDWSLIHDTSTMVSLVDGGRPTGLKLAAARHVDPRAAAGERLLKNGMDDAGWTWATVPLDFQPYWGYAGLDCVLTARLAEALWPQVQSGYAELYELERASSATIYGMESRGARIDPVYTEAKRAELSAEVAALTAWGKTSHGMAIGSPQQLLTRLLSLGAVITRLTDKGNLSTDAVTLTLLGLDPNPELAELARKALRARKARKTVSAYLDNFLELMDGEHRLHPSIRQQGARTGRMSVAQPSLQNLTRGPEVRDCFIASDGHKLITADYDQIEMRLLYHYCRDPNLREAILSGDLHTTTARLVYGDPTITKDDWRRQPAKSAGFAKVYGAGVEQFSATAGVTVEEGRRFLELYAQAFPGVDPFMGRVQATGRQRLRDTGEGWVKTAAGRRQVASPDKLYTLTNYLIQGTAADVLKRQMVRLDQAGLGDYMILPVHDELVFDVPEAEVEEAVRVIGELMPVPEEVYGVPLTVGIDVYDRWGEKYSLKGQAKDDPLEVDLETGEAA